VFSWKVKDESKLVPIFRTVHFLQLVAVITITTSLFLVWWKSDPTMTAFDLFGRGITRLKNRDVSGAINPLLVLWLLWPLIVAALLRAITGMIVAPVSYRVLALLLWGAAMLALVHFFVTFGSSPLPENSPLDAGAVGPGFWLTGLALVILGLLLAFETRIKLPDRPWAQQGPVRSGPVDDAERLWRGDYQTCPHCGMLNEPGARTCYNCQNLLFDFDRAP
jgi:hypothetical protein